MSTTRAELNRRQSAIQLIAPLVLVIGAAAASPALAQDEVERVYVANQGSDTVSVIDVERLSVIATVPVEDNLHNVNHTPDSRWLLVTNKNVNLEAAPSLSLIDPQTNEVSGTVRMIGKRIEHVVSTAPELAFVSEDLGHNAVVGISLADGSISNLIPVGVKPHGLWPSPDAKSLFVPNQLSRTLSKIDVLSGKTIAEADVGRTPTMTAVSPDGNTVYVTLFGERGVAVADANKVESGRMQVNDVVPVGARPAQVAVSPDGRLVLVPCEGPGALYVINSQTHAVEAIVPTGARAHGVDVSSDGALAFVSNWGADSVSVVDLREFKILRHIPVGDSPAGIDFVQLEPGQ